MGIRLHGGVEFGGMKMQRQCLRCEVITELTFSHVTSYGRKRFMDSRGEVWESNTCYQCCLARNRARKALRPKKGKVKLTPEVMAMITQEYRRTSYSESNIKELAKRYGVNRRSISNKMRQLGLGGGGWQWTKDFGWVPPGGLKLQGRGIRRKISQITNKETT